MSPVPMTAMLDPNELCRCRRCPRIPEPEPHYREVMYERAGAWLRKLYPLTGRVRRITRARDLCFRLWRANGDIFVVDVRANDGATVQRHEFEDLSRAETVYDALVSGEALPR